MRPNCPKHPKKSITHKKAAPTFLLDTFVIKNDLTFLCAYFGLEGIIVAGFFKQGIWFVIDIRILGVTT